MSVYLNNVELNDFKLGATDIDFIYQGSSLIWQRKVEPWFELPEEYEALDWIESDGVGLIQAGFGVKPIYTKAASEGSSVGYRYQVEYTASFYYDGSPEGENALTIGNDNEYYTFGLNSEKQLFSQTTNGPDSKTYMTHEKNEFYTFVYGFWERNYYKESNYTYTPLTTFYSDLYSGTGKTNRFFMLDGISTWSVGVPGVITKNSEHSPTPKRGFKPTTGRFRKCKLYHDGVLCCIAFPCRRKSDGVLGLFAYRPYDSSNKTQFSTYFIEGNFTAGPVTTRYNKILTEADAKKL